MESFIDRDIQNFYKEAFTLSPRFNRIGYCFTYECFSIKSKKIEPDTVFPGVIQIPGSGQPLLIFYDGPTTGGYPRIGIVASADLDFIAQLPVSSKVFFKKTSLEEAVCLLKQQKELHTKVKEHIQNQ